MFKNGSYANVVAISEKEGHKKARIITFSKDQNGDSKKDFDEFVEIWGKAKEVALAKGDNIKLVDVGVKENFVDDGTDAQGYKKEKKYVSYVLLDVEIQSTKAERDAKNATANNDGDESIPEGIGDELPFN